jgi:spore germination protein
VQAKGAKSVLFNGLRRAAFAVLGMTCLIATAAIPAQPNPVRHPVAYGYYADDDSGSWASLQARGHRLAGVITTSFTIADSSGHITGNHDSRIIDLARARGNSVHARVANFANDAWSREVAHALLTDPGARARGISEILQLLDVHGYDGIHLALQNVAPQDRLALSAFVFDLSQQIHDRGRVLSISVPGKISDQRTHEWTGAFDYTALAQASDWIVVMAYHEHWSNSRPGPVASLPWVEAVLRFAVRTVPQHKLVLGIAFHGYVWSDRPSEMISMREAQRRATQSGAQVRWDEDAQVAFFATSQNTVYFENARSVELRIILATRFGVAGVALWRLGYESPDVWDSLGTFLRSSVRSAAR